MQIWSLNMSASEIKARADGTLSGIAGVHFTVGELSRLGWIALPTVKNTKGIDIIASTADFKRTVHIQVKSNKNKYNFWIVGEPLNQENIFYVFVNLLSDKSNCYPEYYIVPSKDVYAKFASFQDLEKNPTEEQMEAIKKRIKNREKVWDIVSETGIHVQSIREIAKSNGLTIKYDRGKGENFPFCFYIKTLQEIDRYSNNWDALKLY